MINNVTVEKLEEKFKGEGFDRFAQIAKLGGFGVPTRDHTGGVDPAYRGGLDLKGLSEVTGPDRLPEATLAKIQELAGSSESGKASDSPEGSATPAKATTKGKETN